MAVCAIRKWLAINHYGDAILSLEFQVNYCIVNRLVLNPLIDCLGSDTAVNIIDHGTLRILQTAELSFDVSNLNLTEFDKLYDTQRALTYIITCQPTKF